jgi:hypothetical protein
MAATRPEIAERIDALRTDQATLGVGSGRSNWAFASLGLWQVGGILM